MNKYENNDIKAFCQTFTLKEPLRGASFLITGITGLIGKALTHCLLAIDDTVVIVAPVRNVEKAVNIYSKKELERIKLIQSNLLEYNYTELGKVDYIIHCAAPTSSRFFVEHPVETSEIIYEGTVSLLRYAKENPVKSFVFLSSLEVYGTLTQEDLLITEDIQGYLDPMSVRSSYPMGKRMAENICCLFSAQYGVPVKIARLTQTTGAGIATDDNRIIAQFARKTARNEDIILCTSGESARPYCYIVDAISAILYILFKGEIGKAYNVANEETYISAIGMANYLKNNFNNKISVRVELNDNTGYAPCTKLKLSNSLLRSLGWSPRYGLYEIFDTLIKVIKDTQV